MIYIFANSVNGQMSIYLDEKLRPIPNPQVLKDLFPDPVTYISYDNDQILAGHIGINLPTTCRLVRPEGQAPVYLVDQDGSGTLSLRHIVDQDTFNAYQFDWNKIQDLPASDPTWNIAKGADISNLGSASNTWMHRLQVDFSAENGPAVRIPHLNVIHRLGKDNDLFCIWKNGTGTHKTEVHQLTASSNYAKAGIQVGTAFDETDEWWDFVIAPDNNDLVGIEKQNTGSGKTEIHILSAKSNYQTFTTHAVSGLDYTDHNWQFAMAPNRDLVGIFQKGGSNKTEVHILSAASDYKDFTLHSATEWPVSGAECDFSIDGDRNLVICKKWDTGTNSTEVHILTASSNYKDYEIQTGTALPETDCSRTFLAASNLDVYAVFSQATGSKKTEVHMLSTSSHYRNFGLHAAIPFLYSDTANFQMKQGEFALYEGPNYTGRCWHFNGDCTSLAGIDQRPGTIGSIKIGAGTGVLLYEGENYGGPVHEIIQSNAKLLGDIGSFKIYDSENPAKAQIGSSVLLTEDYRKNSQGQMESYKAYQSIINVSPGTETLQVWAEKQITIHVDDQNYTIDQVQSASLKVSTMQNVVISTEATAIGTSALRVRTDQMAANDYVLIFPDRQVHQKVAAMPDGTLHTNRDALGIHPNVSQEDCDHVQKSVQNMARAVKYPAVDSLAPPSISHEDMDDKHWKIDFTENGPKYEAISAQESQQILNGASVSSAGALSWWNPWDDIKAAYHATKTVVEDTGHVIKEGADDVAHGVEDAGKDIVKIGSVVVHSIDHVVKDAVSEASKGLHAIEGPIQGAVMAIGGGVIDLGKDIEHGVINAADAVAGGIESAVAMTIQFADKAVSFVVSHVEQVGRVIGMVLEQIGAEIVKIVDFLASLFDWQEIERIKNYITGTINQTFNYVDGIIPQMESVINNGLNTAESDINGMIDEARQYFGVKSDMGSGESFGDEVIHKITWFLSKIMGHNNPLPSLSGNQSDGPVQKFVEKITELGADDVAKTIEEFGSKLESMITDPKNAPKELIGFFLDTLQRVVDSGVEALKYGVDDILNALSDFFKDVLHTLNSPITIPFISDILKFVGLPSITFMDVLGYFIAIPMEIIEKIRGTKFFTTDVALSSGEKLGFSIANGIISILGGILGATQVALSQPVPIIGHLQLGCGVLYQIFRWPGGYPQKIENQPEGLTLVWMYQWCALVIFILLSDPGSKAEKGVAVITSENIRLGLLGYITFGTTEEKTDLQKASTMMVPLPALLGVLGREIKSEEVRLGIGVLILLISTAYSDLVIAEGAGGK
ncbi:MAG: hypothetical protein R8G66_01650 [Cytophagales bacterium]|nr:hypothetical protein [Cytophagales bacterium]